MNQKILLPGERRQGGIIIQTRKGNNIPNVQEYDLPLYYLNQAEEISKKYKGPFVKFVNNPSAIYNCHGLVFGARRSSVSDSNEVMKIINEDDYEKVEQQDVRIGDIIIYFSNDGDAEHSGLIIGRKEGLPIVLSKWGMGKEAVHIFSQCPYNPHNIQFYRVSK